VASTSRLRGESSQLWRRLRVFPGLLACRWPCRPLLVDCLLIVSGTHCLGCGSLLARPSWLTDLPIFRVEHPTTALEGQPTPWGCSCASTSGNALMVLEPAFRHASDFPLKDHAPLGISDKNSSQGPRFRPVSFLIRWGSPLLTPQSQPSGLLAASDLGPPLLNSQTSPQKKQTDRTG
jgi:hypothetical protein